MKKATATLLLFLMVITLFAEGLEPSAIVIKKNFPDGYNIIKQTAIAKWDTDSTMILYEINNQCSSLMNVLEKAVTPETGDMSVFIQVAIKWSIEGWQPYNKKLYDSILDGNGSDFLKAIFGMHCNWTMVEYEYNNQIKAAAAY